jgi:hypothetical protein
MRLDAADWQLTYVQTSALRPLLIACISRNGAGPQGGGGGEMAVARWREIGAFWGAIFTQNCVYFMKWRLWCAVVRNRGFLGGDFHSLRTGGNPSARGVAVCDWNQYQYGVVISYYTHASGGEIEHRTRRASGGHWSSECECGKKEGGSEWKGAIAQPGLSEYSFGAAGEEIFLRPSDHKPLVERRAQHAAPCKARA